MRPFELLLITANAISLWTIFGKRGGATRVWCVGINLLAFGVHAGFEGVRYQMTPAYVLVGLLAAVTALGTVVRPFRGEMPRWLKGSAALGVLVSVSMTAFLATALPVFQLPPPTGPRAVGVRYVTLIDAKRRDPFRSDSPRPRALMVKLFYPAEPDAAKPFAPYFNGSSRLLHEWAKFYGMPAFAFDHLALVKTHGKIDLPIARDPGRFPIVVFSHGAGTSVEVSTSQCEDLASHGYVVASVDHPYVSAATVFPDRIVTAHEATANFDTPEPAEPITRIMADDDRFVLDELARMDRGEIFPALRDKLDLDSVGVIGHSVGGAVAYDLAIHDPRIRAAIDLDGTVYVSPPKGRHIAPFLLLANDRYYVQAIETRTPLMPRPTGSGESQAAYERARRNIAGLADVVKASNTLYTITGSDHMKFSDIGLFIGNPALRDLLQIGGSTDPARCLAITEAVTRAFFDEYVRRGRASGHSIEALLGALPELRRKTANRPGE